MELVELLVPVSQSGGVGGKWGGTLRNANPPHPWQLILILFATASLFSRNYTSADWLTINLSISTAVFWYCSQQLLSIQSWNYAWADWLTSSLSISIAVFRDCSQQLLYLFLKLCISWLADQALSISTAVFWYCSQQLLSIHSQNYASADWLTIDLSISTAVFRYCSQQLLSIQSRNYASADWLTIDLSHDGVNINILPNPQGTSHDGAIIDILPFPQGIQTGYAGASFAASTFSQGNQAWWCHLYLS